jgi:hypothetical protein
MAPLQIRPTFPSVILPDRYTIEIVLNSDIRIVSRPFLMTFTHWIRVFIRSNRLTSIDVNAPIVEIQSNPAEARSGDYLVHASGSPTSATSSLYYYAISETKIPVTPEMEFSFWKKTNNSLGRYVSADLKFTSGKVLRDLPAYRDSLGSGMHPGDGRGTVGAGWEKTICVIGTGELLGDTIEQIIIAYDHPK